MRKQYHVQYAGIYGEWETYKKCFTLYGARKCILKKLRDANQNRMWRIVLVEKHGYVEKVLYGIYVLRCNTEYINRIFNTALQAEDDIYRELYPHTTMCHKSLIG